MPLALLIHATFALFIDPTCPLVELFLRLTRCIIKLPHDLLHLPLELLDEAASLLLDLMHAIGNVLL